MQCVGGPWAVVAGIGIAPRRPTKLSVGREGAEAQLCRLLADTLSALEPHDRLLSWGRVTLGLQVTHGQRDRQEP
jgi:hypothetical protein